MPPAQKGESNPPRRLRLWPGVAAVVLQWLLWLVVPAVAPEAVIFGMLGAVVGGGSAVLLWWLFFSRAAWSERLGALALAILAMAATPRILHHSIATAEQGMLFYFYVIPVLCLALVVWGTACGRLSAGRRRAALAAAILVSCGLFALFRTEGVTGGFHSQFAWRWARTSEQKLLATESGAAAAPSAGSVVPGASAPAEWPGFRGPRRDSVVFGLQINSDWRSSPPVQLWRRAVGPGWSSFAVGGGLFYTQEQRGDSELVSCYDLRSGKPVWVHRDPARFYESNAGAGPRGTPFLHGGRVYALGATGILNALDAATGAVAWTRKAAAVAGVKTPGWGFASSPLAVGDLLVVALSGRLAAYDLASGEPRWLAPDEGESYASPHLVNAGGAAQILLLAGSGPISVSPTDGRVLWKHSWKGFAALQPAFLADGGILVDTSADAVGLGVRRLSLEQGPGGWTARELWTSTGLKPYFNDMVVHNGYAYGFDGGILSCIDLKDGKRIWKGGRYGYGQMLLLKDQGLLLILSEEGELALVSAAPTRFTEIARFPALEGKTWNHPALAGDVLLVRNDREMAAFRLPAARN